MHSSIILSIHSDSLQAADKSTATQDNTKDTYRSSLADMPLPLMNKVVAQLGPEDLITLSKTCRFFHAMVEEAVPNLLLSLYAHQARF